MEKLNKAFAYIGGKRGLAVLLGAFATIAVQLGWVTPEIATKLSDVAAGLGIAGIAHNATKVA